MDMEIQARIFELPGKSKPVWLESHAVYCFWFYIVESGTVNFEKVFIHFKREKC